MKKKAVLIFILVFAIIIIFISVFFTNMIRQYNSKMSSLSIDAINPKIVKNGIYEGFCDLAIIKVKVNVTVYDGKITEITILKHDNGKGKAAEAIIQDVIKNQSLQVDTISGATGSSKAILKAIEDGLKKGL